MNKRQTQILELLQKTKVALSTAVIVQSISRTQTVSEITLKRDLNDLVEKKLLVRQGKARATKYQISPNFSVVADFDVEEYFKNDIDERPSMEGFQFDIFNKLNSISVFSDQEDFELKKIIKDYQGRKLKMSPTLLKREFERLTIELSWKSSAIEGNTYSLLETESLLKDGVRAKGKKQEDAVMLLNHKYALDFIRKNSRDFKRLSLRLIEEVHRILIKDLGVSPNIRNGLVAITGTQYRPLDNAYQIREALESACLLINKKKNSFERAFWAVVLISYIQPFEDGNKRTSRMISTALLLAEDALPLSYRSVQIDEYKKAMLVFYERNNISAFKNLFIDQIRFASKNYFLNSIS